MTVTIKPGVQSISIGAVMPDSGISGIVTLRPIVTHQCTGMVIETYTHAQTSLTEYPEPLLGQWFLKSTGFVFFSLI